MEEILEREIKDGIYPFMKCMFQKIAAEGKDIQIDGVKGYNESAQFVGGKVINMSIFTVTELLEGDEYRRGLDRLSKIIEITSDLPMETWGILNALQGLYRLQQRGIRKDVISDSLWDKLREKLDWRTFIDCNNHLALIAHPTNYYGVAFGIARYRELLGWEEEIYSRKLLDRFIEHINQFSGEYEFMDETPGQGRFDRYSILVPAEVTLSILDTGMELPDKIISMLKKSADICLRMYQEDGYGFSYGRSTGAYGDTGAMQVLYAASRVPGVLSPEDQVLAYSYCTKIISRFSTFWIDKDMQSINMWEHGRGTDAYRNKNRILGENMSLCMQIVALKDWKAPEYQKESVTRILREKYPETVCGKFYPFAKGNYGRGLAVVRNRGHVWSLPLISGGDGYFQTSPYLPVPYSQFMVTGIPEKLLALLVPLLITDRGRKLMPIVYMRNIRTGYHDGIYSVSYDQDEMCAVGEGMIFSDPGIKSHTEYTWKDGEVSRKDVFTTDGEVTVIKAEMEFLTFSEGYADLPGGIAFERGTVKSITAEGYDTCHMKLLHDQEGYRTPDGAVKQHIIWEKHFSGEKTMELSWTMQYGFRGEP
jgi:hypothetical protein